jgi:hypothetical protein
MAIASTILAVVQGFLLHTYAASISMAKSKSIISDYSKITNFRIFKLLGRVRRT